MVAFSTGYFKSECIYLYHIVACEWKLLISQFFLDFPIHNASGWFAKKELSKIIVEIPI